jgi:hypothetical protein
MAFAPNYAPNFALNYARGGGAASPANVSCLVVERRQIPIRGDNLSRFGCVFFTDQKDRTSHTGKGVLNGVDRLQVGLDSRGLQQALHDEGFVFLLGIENLDQLLVGVRSGISFGRGVWHASSDKDVCE